MILSDLLNQKILAISKIFQWNKVNVFPRIAFAIWAKANTFVSFHVAKLCSVLPSWAFAVPFLLPFLRSTLLFVNDDWIIGVHIHWPFNWHLFMMLFYSKFNLYLHTHTLYSYIYSGLFLSFLEMQRQSMRKWWHMLDQRWIVLLCMSCRWVDMATTLYFEL